MCVCARQHWLTFLLSLRSCLLQNVTGVGTIQAFQIGCFLFFALPRSMHVSFVHVSPASQLTRLHCWTITGLCEWTTVYLSTRHRKSYLGRHELLAIMSKWIFYTPLAGRQHPSTGLEEIHAGKHTEKGSLEILCNREKINRLKLCQRENWNGRQFSMLSIGDNRLFPG